MTNFINENQNNLDVGASILSEDQSLEETTLLSGQKRKSSEHRRSGTVTVNDMDMEALLDQVANDDSRKSQGARMREIIADQIFTSNRGTMGNLSKSHKTNSSKDKTFLTGHSQHENSVGSPSDKSVQSRMNFEEVEGSKSIKKGFWKKLL